MQPRVTHATARLPHGRHSGQRDSALAQVRTASCSALNCVNTFGDEQLAVDVLADKLLFEALKYSVRAVVLSWLALMQGRQRAHLAE